MRHGHQSNALAGESGIVHWLGPHASIFPKIFRSTFNMEMGWKDCGSKASTVALEIIVMWALSESGEGLVPSCKELK